MQPPGYSDKPYVLSKEELETIASADNIEREEELEDLENDEG